MTIQQSEIKFYKSASVNDTASNGGYLSKNVVATDKIFPSAQNTERINGSTKYRKIFVKVENTDDLMFSNCLAFMLTNTPGEDTNVIAPGTQSDTQGSMTIPRWYGCGLTNEAAGSGGTTITLVQDNTLTLFQHNDMAMITDKTNSTDINGNIEYFQVDTVGQTGGTVTLTIGNSYQLIHSFNSGAKVASVIDCGNVYAHSDNITKTSSAGTFDSANILCDSFGTIREDWTLTFTSPTEFMMTGDRVGVVATGTKTTDYAPQNPDFNGHEYFAILSGAWGGTWQSGDTVVFKTYPAAAPIWFKRIIPQNCQTISDNSFKFSVVGDSDGV